MRAGVGARGREARNAQRTEAERHAANRRRRNAVQGATAGELDQPGNRGAPHRSKKIVRVRRSRIAKRNVVVLGRGPSADRRGMGGRRRRLVRNRTPSQRSGNRSPRFAVGASTVRRFHDRDRSGWWVLPIAVGILVASTTIVYTSNLDAVAFTQSAMRGRTSELAAVLILFTGSWIAMIASVPSIIIMSGRGTPGVNRFGPPPKGQGEKE